MPMTLAELLAGCGPLTQARVVTVGVQIARELATLHATGHVYANVNADSVLVDDDGRPALAPAISGGGDPADDVRALCDLLRDAAGANAGLALLRVLGSATESAALAADLYAVCPPAPLLTEGGTSRRKRATVAPAIALAGLLVIGAFAGVAWARTQAHHAAVVAPPVVSPLQLPPQPAPMTTAPASPASVSAPNWLEVMRHLDARRDHAFATGTMAELAGVYVPGTSALAEDMRALHALVSHHAVAHGLHLDVITVTVLTHSARNVSLRVTDRLPAYDVVSSDDVVAHRASRGSHTWSVWLMQIGPAWRIEAIR